MAVRHLIPLLLLAGLTLPATAQSDNDVPLGDLARALRTSDTPSQHDVIDNDNLSDAMEDARTQPLDGTPVFSIKGGSNKFQMSSPDGTCSLSFNANATALISDPIVNRELPQNELAKLDGPAIINSDTLEVSIYNGTGWNLTELTIGLTVIRHDNPDEPEAGSTRAGKLVPAALHNIEEPVEGGASVAGPMARRSDTTVLYHLKGAAAPLKTTTFREIMASALEPGTEWHWAIVQAKGTPPKVVAPTPGVNLTAPLTLPVLPSLPQPEVKPPALRPPAATIVP